mgnify:CR=1 FL=1
MADKKEIAEANSTDLSTFDDSLLSGGTGLEKPQLRILRSLLLGFYNLCPLNYKNNTVVM